eukprot:TRINITY_DN21013_c0_g1_i1.p2 TRINITY_DN21013_c0_g1~~TRINITY_DN21013_c0_g1_i1.p2  ORF type:complete len:121 (+),score=12.24 TRINITY_DN21013_c0_g1_i1:236-598(+)
MFSILIGLIWYLKKQGYFKCYEDSPPSNVTVVHTTSNPTAIEAQHGSGLSPAYENGMEKPNPTVTAPTAVAQSLGLQPSSAIYPPTTAPANYPHHHSSQWAASPSNQANAAAVFSPASSH